MPGYAQPYVRRGVGVSWLLVIYLVAGGIVARRITTGRTSTR
jgi:hypothetical protein